jgi:enolase-phosphatase E1
VTGQQGNNAIRTNAIDVLLLDIEGTTTPIDFVYNTLFPYARTRMSDYVANQLDAVDNELLRSEFDADSSHAKPKWNDPPLGYLLWLMDNDRKSRALKSIQGKIWEEGYRNRTLVGALFSDVFPALKQWKSNAGRIYIYSSGSVKAQQLLFTYSEQGDLTPLLDGYFDTEVGAKTASASYQSIADRIGATPHNCLFVSDNEQECSAAQSAGYHVLVSIRPGNASSTGEFKSITSFEEIFPVVTELVNHIPYHKEHQR